MERINKIIDFPDGGKYVGQVVDDKFDEIKPHTRLLIRVRLFLF